MFKLILKNKKKMIVGGILLLALIISFWYGDGNTNSKKSNDVLNNSTKQALDSKENEDKSKISQQLADNKNDNEDISKRNEEQENNKDAVSENKSTSNQLNSGDKNKTDKNISEKSQTSKDNNNISKKNISDNKSSDKIKVNQDKKLIVATQEPKRDNLNTTKPSSSSVKVKETCTISISCKEIFNNMDKLDSSKKSIVPSDGWVLKSTKVNIKDGDTVFDILERVLKEKKIHLEATKSTVYGTAYIEGIANIYEFDCGEQSGWIYSVNGITQSQGSSKKVVKNGDIIKWIYTCNMGKDIQNIQ